MKAAALVLALVLTAAPAAAEHYPAVLIVSGVDAANDLVTLTDTRGHAWTYPGAEDWTPGDMAAAIMDDNNTPHIDDDTIISLRYSAIGPTPTPPVIPC